MLEFGGLVKRDHLNTIVGKPGIVNYGCQSPSSASPIRRRLGLDRESLDAAIGFAEAIPHADTGDTPLDASTLFSALSADVAPPQGLRAAIAAAHRRPEPECVAALIDEAAASPEEAPRILDVAAGLAAALRDKLRSRASGVEGLIHEYSLSSQEGVALMCLAEALLRIPDAATRDALIRDKLSPGDWRAHVGQSPSLFVNAATWGLMITGKLVTTTSEQSLTAAVGRLIARGGEPLIRSAVNLAMRLMGEQFVAGQTIGEALERGQAWEARGFRYSYDML